jgi:hypothetical protein
MSDEHAIDSYTLLELVAMLGGIRIPMIQRDYAQGRNSWANPRKRFIEDLKKALLPENRPLHLDFVYGTNLDEDGIPAFCPLDGQQRLTTLFLLHWYLAVRDGRFADFQTCFRTKTLVHFSYQVRPGGRSFFEALVNQTPPSGGSFADGTPAAWIRETPWFRTVWERDPTVAGTLTMLDAIHDCFHDAPEGCYDRLTAGNRITFHLLDLGEIGLHDDLYLRMNARGRALSSFETFKARYEKHLEDHFPQATDLRHCKVQDTKTFGNEIDKEWLDFIWQKSGCWGRTSDDTSAVDTAFMNLFRAVALVSLDSDSSGKKDTKDAALALTEQHPDFDEFIQGGWLSPRFTTHLIHVLEAWTRDTKALDLMGNPWFGDGALFDKIVRAGTTKPTLAEYLQFAAFVRFITRHGPILADSVMEAFDSWMRVVRNLTVNTDLETDTFRNQLGGLDELVKKSKDILNDLASREVHFPGFNQQQYAEERLKASLLLGHEDWRDLIHQAENHGYFRGQIDFLLDFSGAKTKPVSEWTIQDHLETQEQFSVYLRRAALMFDTNGLADIPNFLWQRALLATGDYLFPSGDNLSFMRDDRNLAESWKRLLRGGDDAATNRRALLKNLLGEISVDDDLNTQLDVILQKQAVPDYWRMLLIHTPTAIGYCTNRWIRKYSDTKVYLLRSSQMNGYHAELSTYCLWKQNDLESNRERFQPLICASYVECKGTNDDSPHIHFHFHRLEKVVSFLLYCNEEAIPGFSLWTKVKDLDETLILHLRNLGFTDVRDWLVRRSETDPYDGVAFLQACADTLVSIPPAELTPEASPTFTS